MSFLGYVLRKTGAYDRLQRHFAEQLIPAFALAGQVSTNERRFLSQLARTLSRPGPIIEIGTLFGASTRVLAEGKDPERKLITVDKFVWNPCGIEPRQHRGLTQQILHEAMREENVESLAMDKNEFYRTYSGPSPAMVFLDADHSYAETLKDIKWAQSVGTGLIAGHDYAPNMPGVKQAVDECGGLEALVGTVWVLRKRSA